MDSINKNKQGASSEVNEIFEELNGGKTAKIFPGCGNLSDSDNDIDDCLFDSDDFEFRQGAYRNYALEDWLAGDVDGLSEPEENILSDEQEGQLEKQTKIWRLKKKLMPVLMKVGLGKDITFTSGGGTPNMAKIKSIRIGRDNWLLEKDGHHWRANTDHLVEQVMLLKSNNDDIVPF